MADNAILISSDLSTLSGESLNGMMMTVPFVFELRSLTLRVKNLIIWRG